VDHSVLAELPDGVVDQVAPQGRSTNQQSADADDGTVGLRAGALALRRWCFPAEPYARVALFRTIIYLFVIFDIRRLVNDVVPKGYVPAELYQPVLIPRVLHLPAPSPFIVHTLQAVLVGGCLLAAAGFLPRLAGWAVALAFTWWLFIDMSYGKVDHDHLALLVALYVLPTIGPSVARPRSPRVGPVALAPRYVLGRPRTSSTPGSLRPRQSSSGPRATVKGPPTRDTSGTRGDRRWAAGDIWRRWVATSGWHDMVRTEAVGWALRCVQVAVVATYFLSAWAKIRVGGWHWPTGATFAWAVDRRGTALADPVLNYPWVLVAGQWMLITAEALSPIVFFLRGRWRAAFIGFWLMFHLTTYLAITIHFLPTAVGWLAFAPLERTRDGAARLYRRVRGALTRPAVVRETPEPVAPQS
jgi:hypothetical protein